MVRALESKNCYCCLVIISSIISLFLDFWSSDDWPGFSYDSNSLFLRNSNTSRKEETLGEVYKVESDIWFVCCTIRVWNPQALRLLCCRRSSRGHDCWLTWAIRGSASHLTPPLTFECMFFPLFLQEEPLQRYNLERPVCCGDHLDAVWLNSVKASIYIWRLLPKTSLLYRFPCLLNLPPTNLDWPSPF